VSRLGSHQGDPYVSSRNKRAAVARSSRLVAGASFAVRCTGHGQAAPVRGVGGEHRGLKINSRRPQRPRPGRLCRPPTGSVLYAAYQLRVATHDPNGYD
jgi:hypothetical protein